MTNKEVRTETWSKSPLPNTIKEYFTPILIGLKLFAAKYYRLSLYLSPLLYTPTLGDIIQIMNIKHIINAVLRVEFYRFFFKKVGLFFVLFIYRKKVWNSIYPVASWLLRLYGNFMNSLGLETQGWRSENIHILQVLDIGKVRFLKITY